MRARTQFLMIKLSLLLTLLCSGYVHAQQDVAATALSVRGQVTATDEQGVTRSLRRGDNIYSGDLIDTGSRSRIRMKFTDQSTFALRSNTSFRVAEYNFSGEEDGSEKASFSLLAGALEAISGLIGKSNKASFRLDTPLATIGLRGTRFQVEVIQTDGAPIVRVSTLEGAVVYTSMTADGVARPIPENADITTFQVDVDAETTDDEITNILIEAGESLTAEESGEIEAALGSLFDATIDAEGEDIKKTDDPDPENDDNNDANNNEDTSTEDEVVAGGSPT